MQDVHCKCTINKYKGGRLADTLRQSCFFILFCKYLPHSRLWKVEVSEKEQCFLYFGIMFLPNTNSSSHHSYTSLTT